MNQTVTVTTKNTASLTLGIISLVLGVLGLLVGWIPFLGIVGMPAAVIGGFLGILGIIFAVIKGFKGLIMPILGSCICLMAFLLPLASTGLMTKTIEQAAEEASKEDPSNTATEDSTDPSDETNLVSNENSEPPEPTETQEEIYIRDHLEIYEVTAKYTDTFTDKNVPSVTFKIKNKGDESLDLVEVVFYFLDDDGNRIAEQDYRPVSVSTFSFGDNKPLKPGYVWSPEKGKVYTAKSVPSEWEEGEIEFEISEIRFTPRG